MGRERGSPPWYQEKTPCASPYSCAGRSSRRTTLIIQDLAAPIPRSLTYTHPINITHPHLRVTGCLSPHLHPRLRNHRHHKPTNPHATNLSDKPTFPRHRAAKKLPPIRAINPPPTSSHHPFISSHPISPHLCAKHTPNQRQHIPPPSIQRTQHANPPGEGPGTGTFLTFQSLRKCTILSFAPVFRASK